MITVTYRFQGYAGPSGDEAELGQEYLNHLIGEEGSMQVDGDHNSSLISIVFPKSREYDENRLNQIGSSLASACGMEYGGMTIQE